MKNFYFACSKTENGKRYAWVLKIPANHNIIPRIAPDAPDILHPCTTKKEACQIVTHWNDSYIDKGIHLFEPAAPQPLRVCSRCLMAIESREGQQITRKIYLDDDPRPCDWCEDDTSDILYEIL